MTEPCKMCIERNRCTKEGLEECGRLKAFNRYKNKCKDIANKTKEIMEKAKNDMEQKR